MDKAKLSEYVSKLQGKETLTKLSKKTNIHITTLSKMKSMKIDRPPSLRVLRKLGSVDPGVVSYADLMKAAGYSDLIKISECFDDDTTKLDLKNWAVSDYNENTEEELIYYLNELACDVGDIAYLYSRETDEMIELEILRIIHRSDDFLIYDQLLRNGDILLDGESHYNADASAEFITDNDSHLVWFRYGETIPTEDWKEEIFSAKLMKELSHTQYFYTGDHYDGKKTVHTKEFFYDSEEDRQKHLEKMVADGYEADSQIKETVGSFFNPDYVWFGRYWKTEIQRAEE